MTRWWTHLAAITLITAVVFWIEPWGLNIAITSGAVCTWSFVALYVGRSNWRVEPIGRVMVMTNTFLAMVLTLAALSEWTDREFPYRDQVCIIIYSALAYGIAWKIVLLVRAQRADK
ncbi:hypothetical protein [Mycobacteroides franklinii]|uniref:putative phage holin n=1 Tax=Mycobacteroides franklinii TaxID=948102 RepID=UPI000993CFBC|nr:hypothetical protein [Mycobacteroides franklinii]ORA64094.1 hypothetical protein BST24_02690 [Mycobacteroides franklinii]